MSEDQLPEEILEQILQCLLLVSEEHFCKFPGTSLQSERGWLSLVRHSERVSASSALLVSRRWYRIGSPFLYASVVLREQKHTKAVAHLLSFDTRLGEAVRCLRLEGGFGRHLPVVIKHAPNIEVLYISLHVPTSESIRGLHKALSLLQPKTLYMHYRISHARSTKVIRDAKNLVQSAIASQWTSLTNIVLDPYLRLSSSMAEALRHAPALRTLRIDSRLRALNWVRRGHLATILRNPGLSEVRFLGSSDDLLVLQRMVSDTGLPPRAVEALCAIQPPQTTTPFEEDILYFARMPMCGEGQQLTPDINRDGVVSGRDQVRES